MSQPGRVSRTGRATAVSGAVAVAFALLLPGCGSDSPATPPATPPSVTDRAAVLDEEASARAQLAALAAAAEDRRLSAFYALSTDGRPDRSVAVTLAGDGSWRVDIPGGALGGTADVSVAQTADGLFQCALASPGRPIAPICVRVSDPGGSLPADADPRVQHLFTDWARVLTDRQAALSVSVSQPLAGAGGTCFAVESTSASLTAPLEVGIYCYAADGTLTAARVAFGTLVLAGDPAAAPPTVTLPGPMVAGEPLGMASPPPPLPPSSTQLSPTG